MPPVEAECRDLLDRATPEVAVGGALRDPEHELARCTLGFTLAGGPERAEPYRLLELAPGHPCRRTDVEGHRDVRAEIARWITCAARSGVKRAGAPS